MKLIIMVNEKKRIIYILNVNCNEQVYEDYQNTQQKTSFVFF